MKAGSQTMHFLSWVTRVRFGLVAVILFSLSFSTMAGCMAPASDSSSVPSDPTIEDCPSFETVNSGRALDTWWEPNAGSEKLTIEIRRPPNQNHGLTLVASERPTSTSPEPQPRENVVQYYFVTLGSQSFVTKITEDNEFWWKPQEIEYPYTLEYSTDLDRQIGLQIQSSGPEPIHNVSTVGFELVQCLEYEGGRVKTGEIVSPDSTNPGLDPKMVSFQEIPERKHPDMSTLCAYRTGEQASILGESLKTEIEVTHIDGRSNSFFSQYSFPTERALDASIPYGFCVVTSGLALEINARAVFEGNGANATVHAFWMYSESEEPLPIEF